MSDVERIIACGGRDFRDVNMVRRALARIDGGLIPRDLCLVHGAQRGADLLAARVAAERGWAVEPHPPNFVAHRSPAAFHIRNQEMVDAGAALCVAFPGGNGTADCVRRATKAGIPIKAES